MGNIHKVLTLTELAEQNKVPDFAKIMQRANDSRIILEEIFLKHIDKCVSIRKKGHTMISTADIKPFRTQT